MGFERVNRMIPCALGWDYTACRHNAVTRLQRGFELRLPVGYRMGSRLQRVLNPRQSFGRTSYAISIEEKDTFSRLARLGDTVEVAAEMPQTRLVNVCDREADFFELFEEQLRNPSVQLLVSANHIRVIREKPGKLFDAVRQSPLQTKVEVHVRRQSVRPKLSKTKARQKRPGRMAELEVRYLRVSCLPLRIST